MSTNLTLGKKSKKYYEESDNNAKVEENIHSIKYTQHPQHPQHQKHPKLASTKSCSQRNVHRNHSPPFPPKLKRKKQLVHSCIIFYKTCGNHSQKRFKRTTKLKNV